MSDVLKVLGIQSALSTNLTGGTGEPQLCNIDEAEVMGVVFERIKDQWSKCVTLDPRSHNLPEGCGRKMVTYARWMAAPWDGECRPPLPAYLKCGLPKAVCKDVARYRTGSHHLCVETGRWRRPIPTPLSERTCDLCGHDIIQDELHVVLECADPRLRALRDTYKYIVEDCDGDLNDLMQEERTKDLSWFIHECMRVIDAVYLDTHHYEFVDDLKETASSLLAKGHVNLKSEI
jgi:hypothetical protein